MKMLFGVLALVLGAVLIAKPALAQPKYLLPKTDPRKYGGYSPHASSMYGRHARDHARTLYHYGRRWQSVPKERIEEHVAGVRSNLDAANKEMATLKAAKPDDKDVQTQVATIEGHFAKCDEMCKMMQETAASDKPDMDKMCDCCATMCRELDAANAQHDKLMKKLGIEALEDPKSEGSKKR